MQPLAAPSVADALSAVALHTGDAVLLVDGAGATVWANGAFERLSGHAAAGTIGKQPEKLLFGPATDRMATMRLRAALLSGEEFKGEVQHYRSDGTPFWHELSVTPLAAGEGSLRLWMGRDASERRTLARRFLELSAVVELSLDGIAVLDEAQRIRLANSAFARLHGFETGAELQGMSWRSFYSSEQLEHFDRRILQHLALCQQWHGEVSGLRRDGSTFPSELTLSLLSGGMAMVVRDITERSEYEDALRHLSLSDPLTGLYNRRAFTLLAQQLLNVAGRQTGHTLLLYFDLNRFKAINDEFGHQVGDAALVEVAEVLRETFRESDLIARLGGDEFVVLAVNSLDPSGDVLMARLDQRLNARNAAPDRRYLLSMARGQVRFDPARPQSLAELVEEADRAMLAAKRGRE